MLRSTIPGTSIRLPFSRHEHHGHGHHWQIPVSLFICGLCYYYAFHTSRTAEELKLTTYSQRPTRQSLKFACRLSRVVRLLKMPRALRESELSGADADWIFDFSRLLTAGAEPYEQGDLP